MSHPLVAQLKTRPSDYARAEDARAAAPTRKARRMLC